MKRSCKICGLVKRIRYGKPCKGVSARMKAVLPHRGTHSESPKVAGHEERLKALQLRHAAGLRLFEPGRIQPT